MGSISNLKQNMRSIFTRNDQGSLDGCEYPSQITTINETINPRFDVMLLNDDFEKDVLESSDSKTDTDQIKKTKFDRVKDALAGKEQYLDFLVVAAADAGDLETVKKLIPFCDPAVDGSCALFRAAWNGHTDIVELLIPVSDPTAYDSAALTRAAENGHSECVKLLIPVSDTKALDSLALQNAAEGGFKDIVEMLIPVSDPMSLDNYALRKAISNNHVECVKLLMDVCKIENEHNFIGNLDVRCVFGFNALMVAVEGSSVDCIKLLIDSAGSFELRTAFNKSIERDDWECARELINYVPPYVISTFREKIEACQSAYEKSKLNDSVTPYIDDAPTRKRRM